MNARRYKFNGLMVRMLMKQGRISQKELCRRTGLTDTTIRNICTGRDRDPRLSTMTAIANALDLRVEQLIFEVPENAIYGHQPEAPPHLRS